MIRSSLFVLCALILSSCAPNTASSPPELASDQGVVVERSRAEALLLESAREGDLKTLQGLAQAGVSLDAADDRGYTALILSAYHGHLEAVQWLLGQAADPCRGDKRGNTALMGAAFKGHEDVVDLLLAQDCPVDQPNLVGQTALMFSALAGNQAASKLLGRGADRSHRDGMGRTAADWASTQGHALPR